MALSDVTVKVNLVTSMGTEPVWFPLFFCANTSDPKMSKVIEYTECTSLQQLAEIISGILEGDNSADRKKKLSEAVSTSLYKNVEHMYMQPSHPSRFAVASIGSKSSISDVKAALEPYLDRSWRQLVMVGGFSDTLYMALAEYIENLEQRKLLFFESGSSSIKPVTDSETSEEHSLTDYKRTIAVYHPMCGANYPVASVIGAVSGRIPGSINYRNMIIEGVPPVALTEEELEALHNKGFMTLVERAGDVVTSQGKSASSERYIDTIDIEDYVVQQLVYVSQKALNVNDVVPYNSDGISILENAAVSVMLDCCNKGMIARTDTNTYIYDVNYPDMPFVSDEDIKSRTYKLGTVSFTVQGSVDREEITVNMTL